jgi:hypothetical protein
MRNQMLEIAMQAWKEYDAQLPDDTPSSTGGVAKGGPNAVPTDIGQ